MNSHRCKPMGKRINYNLRTLQRVQYKYIMSTHTQILYQIVFSTYKREKTLTKENRKELFQYIWGILKNKDCHLYRINGVDDHIHIITHIHPTIAPANLIKDIKLATSSKIKEQKLFKHFDGWQT